MALVSSSARHSMNCSTHPTASGIAGSGVGGLICRVESRGGVPVESLEVWEPRATSFLKRTCCTREIDPAQATDAHHELNSKKKTSK